MSRHSRQTAYGQRIKKLFSDCYEISWTVDRYYAGNRLRFPSGYSRTTNEKGGRRFAKKWGLDFPWTD